MERLKLKGFDAVAFMFEAEPFLQDRIASLEQEIGKLELFLEKAKGLSFQEQYEAMGDWESYCFTVLQKEPSLTEDERKHLRDLSDLRGLIQDELFYLIEEIEKRREKEK